MTARYSAVPDLDEPLVLANAEQLIYDSALEDSMIGSVGLEVESHLVDLADVSRHVPWSSIEALRPEIESAAGHSSITVEPGGQLELSGPPLPSISASADELRRDVQRVRLVLADHGLGLAHVGADPLRAPRRVNPRPRYAAMEEHFAATGRAVPGATMMCATSALQINLQAGPASGWARRVALAQDLGPTLVAVSACSQWLAGRPAGFASARQHAWSALGARPRTWPDPGEEWVRYALAAPVMFVQSAATSTAVRHYVPFRDWLCGRVALGGRVPTYADLRTHLSTLFPPVRLRGYLEIRYLDMSAPRWWSGVAALTTVLLDDPVAAAAAAEIVEPVADRWVEAERDGLHDTALATAARRCLAVALEHAPAAMRLAVADLAELVGSGRSPGDLVAERIAEIGPAATFAELSHA